MPPVSETPVDCFAVHVGVSRGKYLSRLEENPYRMLFSVLLLTTDAETLQALAILAVAIGIAGIAVLILFAKDKI